MYVLVFPPDMGRKVSGEVTKPTYGCQVTIHSEQEKQMMKMYRREEKRERKRGKGTDDSDSSDAVMTFDPREMRAQRYVSPPKLFLAASSLHLSLSVRLPLCSEVSAPKPTSFCILLDKLAGALQNKKKHRDAACHVFFVEDFF